MSHSNDCFIFVAFVFDSPLFALKLNINYNNGFLNAQHNSQSFACQLLLLQIIYR